MNLKSFFDHAFHIRNFHLNIHDTLFSGVLSTVVAVGAQALEQGAESLVLQHLPLLDPVKQAAISAGLSPALVESGVSAAVSRVTGWVNHLIENTAQQVEGAITPPQTAPVTP